MTTINDAKQQRQADSPLLLFTCTLPNGDVEYWSSHAISYSGNSYSARVLQHNVFDMQLGANDAMDGVSQLSVILANADSFMSELESLIGFKGSRLTVSFVFADLTQGIVTTEAIVVFLGIAGDPEQILENTLKLTFTNKLSLQRCVLPDVRIQSLCPWAFPSSVEDRSSGVDSSSANRFNRFYRCGYSADQSGGRGNLNGGMAYGTCDRTRASCISRGMFDSDASGHATRRFGGIEFIPATYLVRTVGDKNAHLSPVQENLAKYNDAVPLVYGTGWLNAPVVFARNDGNLTRMEVLLNCAKIQGIFTVVVNDVAVPPAVAGRDMSTTGWYSLVNDGSVGGNFDMQFTDAKGNPLGDPYGSLCVLSVVVPNRISTGVTLPTVQVLLQGSLVDRFNLDASFLDTSFSNNPAWVILDILRRVNWTLDEINLLSFANAAAYCDTLIQTTDINGNPLSIPRFQCNLLVTKRQSAAQVIRGVRVGSGLMLRYGVGGLLELIPETTIAEQQPNLPDGSNAVESLANGWPAYEFSDGSASFSGIVRADNESSTVSLLARSVAESSNRLSVEFQDENNQYQQGSLSLYDDADVALMGYEIASQSTALGITNFSQAARVLTLQLNKSIAGNKFVQFQTSFRALKVRPGDIITLTYAKEGLVRQPLRVTEMSLSLNSRLIRIVGQWHEDSWYSDLSDALSGQGTQPAANVQVPRPLMGPNLVTGDVLSDFGISESLSERSDGGVTDTLSISYVVPTRTPSMTVSLPLLSLSPTYNAGAGSINGTYYYAVSCVDSSGLESEPSFTIVASIPNDAENSSVVVTNLSFPPNATAFHVYRGKSPQLLYRIASDQPIALSFTDFGNLAPLPIGPVDPSYDHANFYYRLELAGPELTAASTANSISISDPNFVTSQFVGQHCRLISGTGAGQECQITANTETTLTVSPPWSVMPDGSTEFVVTEASWRFGAVAAASPAQFEVPNQGGTWIEISGRAANVRNAECSADLCPITRWVLGGGAGVNGGDTEVPPKPSFQFAAIGAGNVQVSDVSFPTLVDTVTIVAGTLEIVFGSALQLIADTSLAAPLDISSTELTLADASTFGNGSTLQVGSELLIISGPPTNNTVQVSRGALGSTAAIHSTGDAVWKLERNVFILPYAKGFFENPESAHYSHVLPLPDVRIVSAQLYMTNSQGDGQAQSLCFSQLPTNGLHTYSGGQMSMQVAGILGVQQNATPPLLVDANHEIRGVQAYLGTAATGGPVQLAILQNSTQLCTVTFANDSTTGVADAPPSSPLIAGSLIQLNVTNVPAGAGTTPGRDLTLAILL